METKKDTSHDGENLCPGFLRRCPSQAGPGTMSGRPISQWDRRDVQRKGRRALVAHSGTQVAQAPVSGLPCMGRREALWLGRRLWSSLLGTVGLRRLWGEAVRIVTVAEDEVSDDSILIDDEQLGMREA